MNTYKLTILLLISSLLTTALIGCGSDNPPASPVDAEPENQNQGPNANQPDPEDLAPTPAHLMVNFQVEQTTYPLGARLRPTAKAFDDELRPLEGIRVAWTVTPDEAVEKDGDHNRWTLTREAEITFRACTTNTIREVCGERTAFVSQEAPTITLERPIPGEYFQADDYETIPVEGIVNSIADIKHVVINGQDVPVDDRGRFTHTITPKFGVNTVFVRAFDGVHPDDGLAAASFIWAPEFLPSTEDKENEVITASSPHAIIMKLGQNFFDDTMAPTIISESHILTEDLADILYLVLRYLDLQSQIPDPVVDSDSFVLRVPDLQLSEPRVEIDTTDDGLILYAQVPELTAQTQGYISFSDQTLDLSGQLTARLSIYAAIDAKKEPGDESFTVDLKDFQLAIEDATPSFHSPEANALFELAEGALRGSLEDIILGTVNLSFIDTLPELLENVFNSLEEAMAYQEFELDAGIGDPITLKFMGHIEELTPSYFDGLTGHISADLSASGTSHFPGSPGAAIDRTGPPIFPFFQSSRIQIGLDLGLLNAFFHLLWDAGMLNIDITEMIPPAFANLIEQGKADGRLPPVAAPPTDDEPYDLMLHLGQLELELGWPEQVDRFGARISVGVDLTVAGESIAIDIGQEPLIDIWPIHTTADEPFLPTGELKKIIESQLWPRIERSIGEGLSFALPVPEISGLDEFAPVLEDLNFDIRMTRQLDARAGFLMLDVAFEGELFLP